MSNIETKSSSARKPYHQPVVVSYGSIQAITQARSCSGSRDNWYSESGQRFCNRNGFGFIRTQAS